MKIAPVHPGEVLQEEYFAFQPFGTKAAAARAMGISDQHLSEIIVGKRPMSGKTCVLVAALTGTSPEMWATLQMRFDLWHAMREIDTSAVTTFARELEHQKSEKSKSAKSA